MKYKIVKLLFLGLLLVLFNSCTDYLDTQPLSTNTVDKLYTSADGAELGLTGCYNMLNLPDLGGGTFVTPLQFMMTSGTDEVVKSPGLSRPGMSEIPVYAVNSQNTVIDGNWFNIFRAINRVNYLLNSIDGIDMDEARKKEIKAEGHFFRGFWYFYLALNYGGVPIYTNNVQDVETPRSSLEDVYTFIINDLTIAYNDLNDRNSVDAARVNKWSAAGYLAKVYTYLASCKNNNVGNELGFELNSFNWVDANSMYSLAKNVTDDIINSSGYGLTEKYDYLFRETTEQWKAEESLMTVQGSKSESNGNYNLILFYQVPSGSPRAYGGGYAWLRPTAELYEKYHDVDLRRNHNLVNGFQTNSLIENIEGVNYFVPADINGPASNGYCIGKWRMRDPKLKTIPNKVWSDGDIILLRFADILLLNAEARYFLGDETGARQNLTRIRKRIAKNGFVNALDQAYHKDDFVEELLDSRSRELCFEGWRKIDLIRFGKLQESIMNLDPNLGRWGSQVPEMQSNFQPYMIWFPIPKADIDIYPLDQNPGYN